MKVRRGSAIWFGVVLSLLIGIILWVSNSGSQLVDPELITQRTSLADLSDVLPELKNVNIGNGTYTTVFYLSRTCQPCLEELPAIETVVRLLGTGTSSFVLLWENGALEHISSILANSTVQIDLKGRLHLFRYKPHGFIIGGNGSVEFVQTDGVASMAEYLLRGLAPQDLSDRVWREMKQLAWDRFQIRRPVFKFVTSRCPDCEAEIPEDKRRPDVIYVYSVNADESYGGRKVVDSTGLYVRGLGVQLFPIYAFESSVTGNPILANEYPG